MLLIKPLLKTITHDCTACLFDVLKDIKYTSHTLTEIPFPIAISAFVQLMSPDMHATFIEKESVLDRFVYGSKASKINYESRIPLLIMHK